MNMQQSRIQFHSITAMAKVPLFTLVLFSISIKSNIHIECVCIYNDNSNYQPTLTTPCANHVQYYSLTNSIQLLFFSFTAHLILKRMWYISLKMCKCLTEKCFNLYFFLSQKRHISSHRKLVLKNQQQNEERLAWHLR